jgi:hypothetical protein
LHIPSDSYAYLAGYNELRRGLEGDWRRRPPWLRHDSPNPTGYLHKAITNEARRAKNREEEKERLWGGLKSEPIVDHDVVTNQLQSVEDVRSDPTILNADMIRVIEFLTQDRNPSTRACAVWTLRLLPEGVGPVDVVRAAGAEWWEYQEFQRKAQLWRKKFGKVS